MTTFVFPMKYILIIPRTLWKLFFVLNFLLGLIVLYPLFRILLSKKKWYPAAFRLKRFWASWILNIPGLILKIDYRKPTDDLPVPCIYCANHASYIDIAASYRVIPKYFVYMGKQELEKAPLFRIFFKDMNILVDRRSTIGSHKAFLRAGEELEKGHSMFLYPEGTISSKGKLMPFKNGAFRLAIEKQVPVVPIVFLNNWKRLQNGGFFKSTGRPGICRVVVLEPISTKGMSEADLIPLRTKVHQLMQEELNNYHSQF